MKIVIQSCEIFLNQKDGVFIQEFWKGPIEIDECIFIGNLEYGLLSLYKNAPILQQDDLDILRRYQSEQQGEKLKANQIQPENNDFKAQKPSNFFGVGQSKDTEN
jgi:hypothetical protein